MCIIAYAPKGAQVKDETIKVMFEGNPDGAGIMYKPTDSAQVEIRKGFMTVDALLKAYHEIPVECEKAIHCRIATSGKVSAACCHPFPVRAKTSAMKAAKDTAPMALMHNGIIGYCTPVKGMKADYSDTMLFASRILYPLQKMLDKDALQTLIEESTTSRLLIFRANAETLVLGDWKFDDGVYYSNGSYKPIPQIKRVAGKYGSYYPYGGYGANYLDDCSQAVEDDDYFSTNHDFVDYVTLTIEAANMDEAQKEVDNIRECCKENGVEIDYLEIEPLKGENNEYLICMETIGLPFEVWQIGGHNIQERIPY